MIRVVLDANVYVSALIKPSGRPGRILERLLRDGVFENVVSSAIVEEVAEALGYSRVRRYLPRTVAPDEWFAHVVILSEMVHEESSGTHVCKDPDDDKYVWAALEGRAEMVVTGDRNFLALGVVGNVQIVDPRRFLAVIEAAED